MALKISGSARQSKGSGSSSSFSSTSFRSQSFRGDPRRRRRQQRSGGGGAFTYEDAAQYAATATGDHDEPKEWVAQVEPGVHITFVSLPGGEGGGNDLKRIRFSREMFNKWQAQRWWAENYDRIMELYNVQRYNRQALETPARSDDGDGGGGERESSETPWETTERLLIGDSNKAAASVLPLRLKAEAAATANLAADASRITTSSRDEASVSASNASDHETTTEWVEEDEPGVYITISELADGGTRELRRVRFSREKFGEVHAKLWWEANRDRIHAQYL